MIIFYTLIQIVIESLPISSSGHALLFCGPNAVSSAYDYFLHGFSVLVILMYFFCDYFFLIRSLITRKTLLIMSASAESVSKEKGCIVRLFFTVVIADCVTALWYCILPYTSLQQLPLWVGLGVTGCALLSTYYVQKKNICLSWATRALIVGFVQGVALIPGISRMGCTYAVARWMGLRPYRAMALSLVIQLPLIGVGFLKGVYGLYKIGELAQYFSLFWVCIYGSATGIAYLFLWFTMYVAQREKMWIFGLYILILASLVF